MLRNPPLGRIYQLLVAAGAILMACGSAHAQQQQDCTAAAASPSAAGGPRDDVCCFVPSNTSAEFSQVYQQLCPAARNMSTQMPLDFRTNATAMAEMRNTYSRAFNASMAALYLRNITNATIAGVPVVWASPATTASNANASTDATTDAGAGRLIIYLHGGGYILGSCHSMLAAVGIVAQRAGARVVCPEYRLAPEHPFPAGLNDSAAVYAALLGPGFNHTPASIALVGDSAGGGLVMALLLLLRQRGLPLPAAAGVYSPWTDLSGPTDTDTTLGAWEVLTSVTSGGWPSAMALAYVAGAANLPQQTLQALLAGPLVSPLRADFNASGATGRLPPLLIQVGLREVLLDNSVLLFRRLRAGGQCVFLSPWSGMFHVFQYLALPAPEAFEAQVEMSEFLGNKFLAGGGGDGGDSCCW